MKKVFVLLTLLSLFPLSRCSIGSPSLGPLLECSYSHGGGMMGDGYVEKLYTDDSGEPVLRVESRSAHNHPLLIEEYRAGADALERLRELIDRYRMTAWSKLPMDRDAVSMDGPSTSITMVFDNSEVGGYRRDSYTVNYASKLSENAAEALKTFREEMHRDIGALLDARYENNRGEVVGAPPDEDGSEAADALKRLFWDCGDFTSALNDGVCFRYAGAETVDGTDCHVFALENEAGQTYAVGPDYGEIWQKSAAAPDWAPYAP